MFVGRETEIRLLGGLVEQVNAGIGGAVWVAGAPGIGKSALVAAALDGARHGGSRVCWGAASEQSPIFPLQVLLEVLDEGASGPRQEPEPELVRASRAEIVNLLYGTRAETLTPLSTVAVVAERLVALVHRLCAISPVILVVDDMQWADQASLGVLAPLIRTLRQLPLLLVAVARPVPARAEVTAIRQAMADAGGRTVELGPVSAGETAEITRQLIGGVPGPALAQQLTAAGGNPLYLRELIDALIRESRLRLDADTADLLGDPADLPHSLPAAIGLRLGFLSEAAVSTLRVAAVLGPVFSVTDLSTVSGQRASELSDVLVEAVKAGVLADSGPGTLAFRHELIHHALYNQMPASLRNAMHRQAAEHLAGTGAPAERVAGQLLAAPLETDAWVTDWVARAAPMLSQRAPRVAVDLLERARDGLGWEDHRRAQLDADLAMARLMLGDNEQVVLLARPLLESTSDPAMAGRAAWTLGYALPRLGRAAEAIEVTGQALARDGLPVVWSARLRARRATSLFAVGRYAAARAEAERAEAEGTEAGDRLAVGYALYTLARLDIIDRQTIAAGKDAMERALAVLGDEPQATDLVLQLMTNLGAVLTGLGQRAAADRMFAQIAALVERATPPRQVYVRSFSAWFAFHRGRWDDALAELDAAAQLAPEIYRQYLKGVAAQVAFHRDDRAAADEYLRVAADILPIDGGEIRLEVEYLLVAWALTAERDGNPAEALTRLLAVFDPDATLEFTRLGVIGPQWLPDIIRLAQATGEPAVAAAATKVSAREADNQAAAPVTAVALHCQGLLDHDPAAVSAAAGQFQSVGYPLPSGHALEDAAVLHAEHGDAAAARSAYLEAIGIYHDLGADWDIMRADSRLRQYGIRRGARGTRHRPATGWEALTSTEQKIARLIAEGLSNPDIASELFLSRNTVQTHVSHILTKFNARSRVENARAIPRK